MFQSREDVRQVQRIRRRNEDSVDIGGRAEGFGRIVDPKRELTILLYGLLRLSLISAPETSHCAVLRRKKSWHEASDGVKAEAEDSVADHFTFLSRSSA